MNWLIDLNNYICFYRMGQQPMKKSTLSIISTVCALFVLVTSCGSEQTKTSEGVLAEEDVPEESLERAREAKKILYMMPSPVETANLLRGAGATYDASFLNDISNLDKYETVFEKAINLGIYSADLSYASSFEQQSEVTVYMVTVKKLADRLGVIGAFTDEVIARMEANMSDRDSVVKIVADSYGMIDAHLRENQREHVSALILAGGWIEGLYVSGRIAEMMPDNAGILKCIADQKYSLEKLYGLVTSFPDDKDLQKVKKDLERLKVVYDALEVIESKPITADASGGQVTRIGGGSKLKISPQQVAQLQVTVSEIRKDYLE